MIDKVGKEIKIRTSVEILKSLHQDMGNAGIRIGHATSIGARYLLGKETRFDKSYTDLLTTITMIRNKLETASRRIYLLENPEIAKQIEEGKKLVERDKRKKTTKMLQRTQKKK